MEILKSDCNNKLKLGQCIREHFGDDITLYVVPLSSYFGIYDAKGYNAINERAAEIVGDKQKAYRMIGRMSAYLEIDKKDRVKIPKEFVPEEGEDRTFYVVPRENGRFRSIIVSPKAMYEKTVAPAIAKKDAMKKEDKGDGEDEKRRRKD